MLHAVEIIVKDSILGDEMAQMRTWLDHMGYVPVTFRSLNYSLHSTTFRVVFGNVSQADDFTRAFDGRQLPGASEDAWLYVVDII